MLTAKRCKKIKQLPALRVAIYRGGRRVRIVRIPDPRNAFCEKFNVQAGSEFSAVPVSRRKVKHWPRLHKPAP